MRVFVTVYAILLVFGVMFFWGAFRKDTPRQEDDDENTMAR